MPPIPHSYSIPPTRLHAGEYPRTGHGRTLRQVLQQMLDFGIDTFVDLTEESEGWEPYFPISQRLAGARTLERRHFPIRDVHVTNETGMRRTLDAIDAALEAGRTVYVHCRGGVGRTGTVIGCWLVRRGAAPDEALAEVNRLFFTMPATRTSAHRSTGSPETETQRAFVRDWGDVERRRQAALGSRVSRVKGCLLGGAIGDALGAPVEFMPWPAIRATFGDEGIRDYASAYGRIGAITDDTQMTLWTAEGVIRGRSRVAARGDGGAMSGIPRAYLRWLYTQDGALPKHVANPELVIGGGDTPSGWLLGVRALHSRRAPGNTCLSALHTIGDDLWATARNDSKGCGGVMRVAPLALVPGLTMEERFDGGCRAAAVTHGHPTGILSSGALVWILALLLEGVRLEEAVVDAMTLVGREGSSAETVGALEGALALYRSGRAVSPALVESLGGGWTGEEALAIGVYAALVAGEDFERGIRIGVNHSGDSDSTGSIAGQIIGAQVGVERIEGRWLEGVELREVIETLAEDLVVQPPAGDEEWARRYPGW